MLTPIIVGIIYFLCPWHVSSAVDKSTNDRRAQLRTAYLFNIAKFTDFPGISSLNICIAEHSPLYQYIIELDGRQLGNERDVTVLVNPTTNDSCHIAYIDAAPLNSWQPNQVLMIGELDAPSSEITVIQFFEEADKIRFSINLEHLDTAKYRMSSKLLRLARDNKEN